MFYIHKLNSVESYILHLSRFRKIILYAVPLILSVGVIFMFNTKHSIPTQHNSHNDNIKRKIDELRQKMSVNVDMLFIMAELESYIQTNSLQLLAIKQKKDSLFIEVQAQLNSIVEFIHYAEHFNAYSKVKSLNIEQKENTVLSKVELTFMKYYEKKEIKKQFLIKRDNKTDISPKDVSFKLNAIVGKSVLINDRWVDLNQIIQGYTVEKISMNSVQLISNKSNITLKLYHETQ